MPTTIDVSLPGAVWYDFLSPECSGMQEALELPEPEQTRAGKGSRYTYRAVSLDTAEEIAEYLFDRGDMLLGQGISDPYCPFEKATRAMYRAAMKRATEIRAAIAEARR